MESLHPEQSLRLSLFLTDTDGRSQQTVPQLCSETHRHAHTRMRAHTQTFTHKQIFKIKHTNKQTNQRTNTQTNNLKQTNTANKQQHKTHKHTNKQTNKPTNKQTKKQNKTNKHTTHRHTRAGDVSLFALLCLGLGAGAVLPSRAGALPHPSFGMDGLGSLSLALSLSLSAKKTNSDTACSLQRGRV